MCSRKLLFTWALLLPLLPLFGEVTEQERQRALEALSKVESFTNALQANSLLRESLLQATELSLNERQQLLETNEKALAERSRLLDEKESSLEKTESSLQSRESSLQATKELMEESTKLYERAEKRLKATSFWAKVGVVGAGVLGFLLGSR